MNPATLLARLLRLTRARSGRVTADPTGPLPPVRRARRAARAAVAWFGVAFVALNAAALLAMDVAWPRLRDPEYGRRADRLRARTAEHPGRPVVLVLGSSRVSMGLRPAAWEEARPNVPGRPDPLVFNMSLVGSGPLMELMCLRRVYADGFRPDAVVFEYWPPFLREDGPYWELDRIDPHRLYLGDRAFVRDYARDAAEAGRIDRVIRDARLNPLGENRHRWLAQVFPTWLPWTRRPEGAWADLDGWGWLPGIDEYPPVPRNRAARMAHCEPIYREQFQGYSVAPVADRAVREAVALARTHGAKVAFTYLPESTEFRAWMTPTVKRAGGEHLAALCAELNVPLIDARDWLADGYLVDGFHLSREGAAEFTRKFGPAVAATFPDLGGGR